jgi:predicted metal-dependent hydrolase
MTKITLWRELHDLAERTVKHFKLKGFERLQPTTHPLKKKYGSCTMSGVVELRIHVYGRKNRPLARRTILETLAHELAHLREWNHGRAHNELTQEILAYFGQLGGSR